MSRKSNPRDLERLAFRIERLQKQATHTWMPQDGLSFRNQLPDGRGRRTLPFPAKVREEGLTWAVYKNAIQMCLRMEILVSQNRQGSMRQHFRRLRKGHWRG